MSSGIQFLINPPVINLELNALFANAWPEPYEDRDFMPVLEKSLSYICAYQDTELVGFINIAWDGGLHAFLLDTTVHTRFRRQGIGQKLIEKAKSLRSKLNLTVYQENPRSIDFYLKSGFSISGERLDEHTGHKELLMEYNS